MKARQWNAFAGEYDLVVDTAEDYEQVELAADALYTAMASMPGWVIEEAGLDKALALLNNAVVKEGNE